MKLLVFSPYYPPAVGGLMSHADEFNRHFAERGAAITVFTPHVRSESPAEEVRYGRVRVVRFPAVELVSNWPLPSFWQRRWWRCWRELARGEFDVVISRTRFFLTSLLAWRFARTRNVPWLHIEHGSDFVQHDNPVVASLAHAYDITFGRAVLNAADAVVANSQATKKFVRQLSAGREAKVIYRGVDAPAIAAVVADSDIQRRFAGRTVIAFVGRLISGKGVADLLAAVAKLHSSSVQCLLVGDGPDRGKLMSLVSRLAITDRVTFLGECSLQRTIAILKACDIFVNPSYTEGIPTSVIEAAMCGVATVATNVGGTAEVITHEHSGLLVPPRDIVALTTQLDRLVANADERQRLGKSAQAAVTAKFNWSESIAQHEAIIKNLLTQKV